MAGLGSGGGPKKSPPPTAISTEITGRKETLKDDDELEYTENPFEDGRK
jgi:hypothetical protein